MSFVSLEISMWQLALSSRILFIELLQSRRLNQPMHCEAHVKLLSQRYVNWAAPSNKANCLPSLVEFYAATIRVVLEKVAREVLEIHTPINLTSDISTRTSNLPPSELDIFKRLFSKRY